MMRDIVDHDNIENCLTEIIRQSVAGTELDTIGQALACCYSLARSIAPGNSNIVLFNEPYRLHSSIE